MVNRSVELFRVQLAIFTAADGERRGSARMEVLPRFHFCFRGTPRRGTKQSRG